MNEVCTHLQGTMVHTVIYYSATHYTLILYHHLPFGRLQLFLVMEDNLLQQPSLQQVHHDQPVFIRSTAVHYM